MAGLGGAREVDVVELHAQNPAEEMIVREALGLDREGDRSRRSIRRAARSAAIRS